MAAYERRLPEKLAKAIGKSNTPKKPKRVKGKEPTLTGNPPLGYLNSYFCPVCSKHLFSVYDGDLKRPDYKFRVSVDWNYCSRCGQPLDLEEFKEREGKAGGEAENSDIVLT